jgi:glycerophosphoryl diester phosphodiesterase|tara:strand:+ start:5613 stop:6320 length:708 start_codon:yes stop_codon:yes gene_type:complete
MLNIAHRGASGYITENSLESFNLAIEMGADIIEMDIRQCKTGELVIYHNLCCNGNLIDNMSKDECIEQNIVIFADVLKKLSHRVKIYLDLKTPFLCDKERINLYMSKVMENIIHIIGEKYFTENEIILASFDHNLIKCLKKNLCYLNIYPKFGLIFSSNPIKYNNYNTNICDYIIQSKSSLNMKFLNFCKEKKIKILVYTVNDNKVMNLLFKTKIDGIITNYPDILNDIKMCNIV